jgi:hypothetical protein
VNLDTVILQLKAALTTAITVNTPPAADPTITGFTVTPTTITAGQSVVLSAIVSNASLVTLDGSPITLPYTTSPAASRSYSIVATGAAGTSPATSPAINVTVDANPPPPLPPTISGFAATPTTVIAGGSVVLSATVANTTQVTLDGVNISLPYTFVPTLSRNYQIVAIGGAGTTPATSPAIMVTVTPQPTISNFVVAPSSILVGQSVVLSAVTSNTTQVTLDGVNITLPYTDTPSASRNYQLIALGAAGTTPAVSPILGVTVGTTPPPPPPNNPTITNFAATPTTVIQGGTITLSATVTNTVQVTLDGAPITLPYTFAPAGSRSFAIVANGVPGTTPATSNSIAISVVGNPVITSFAVIPSSISAGQSVTLFAALTDVVQVTLDGGVITLPHVDTPSTSRTYQIVATGAAGTTPATSAAVGVTVTGVIAGLPTSAAFTAITSDVRGGDAAYNFLRRMSDGRMIAHGGFSHDRAGNNSVMIYNPVAGTSIIDFPNTPWTDAADTSGRNYLGNHDNQIGGIVDDVLWEFSGERGIDFLGNIQGRYTPATHTWQIEDGFNWAPCPNLEKHENGAFVHIPSYQGSPERWVMFGGKAHGNPTGDLQSIVRSGTPGIFTLEHDLQSGGSAPYGGARQLDFVASQSFSRNGKMYVYGGAYFDYLGNPKIESADMMQIDFSSGVNMAVLGTNSLGNAVKGESLYADYDPARDQVIISNGVNVQIFDFATTSFSDIPVTSGPDNDRVTPSIEAGAPRAACFSPEIGKLIILGGHSHMYKIDLTYGVVNPPGALTMTTRMVGWNDSFSTLKRAKHLHAIMMPDGAAYLFPKDCSPLTFPADASGGVDGNQEVYKLDLIAERWSVAQPYFVHDNTKVQGSNPDDAFIIQRGNEFYYFFTETTLPGNIHAAPDSSYATQIDPRQFITAYTPESLGGGVGGSWRVVGPAPSVIHGDRAWRGWLDPIHDVFVVPVNTGGQTGFCIMRGTDCADLTDYDGGLPWSYGQFFCSVGGVAPDYANRKVYLFDVTSISICVVDMDAIYNKTRSGGNYPQVVLQCAPFVGPLSTQYTGKIAWNDNIKAVCMPVVDHWYVYRPGTGAVDVFLREDGVRNISGAWIQMQDSVYDPASHDIITVGAIDFSDPNNDSRVPGWYRTKFSVS